MTLQTDLGRLQIADPETWQTIALGPPIKPRSEIWYKTERGFRRETIDEQWMPFSELMPEMTEAWLQYCIQRACQKRGLAYKQMNLSIPGPYYAIIFGAHTDYVGTGDSPAAAILKAYLQALEGKI